MRRRWLAGLMLAVIAVMGLVTTATAGGWATVEMEKPVTRVEAGTPLRIDFTLLQHGVTPTDWTTTYLEATNTDTGEMLHVDATKGAEVGQWSVEVTFPSTGTWDWAIKTAELEVEDTFPALEVVGDAAAVSTTGMTQEEVDAAIAGAVDPLEKQISSMSGEIATLQKQTADIDTLQKQVNSLTGEREALQKQIANLEAAMPDQPESTGPAWWVSALAGAAGALIVVAGGAFVALRRGLIRTGELSPATA